MRYAFHPSSRQSTKGVYRTKNRGPEHESGTMTYVTKRKDDQGTEFGVILTSSGQCTSSGVPKHIIGSIVKV